ncbi:MAG: endonuclease I [Bacteroidetes bacterium MedPE-SWsnd-G2]|nr:MAG: endonuclease I [Bacteroidetes bacterium MedPE-SWsnd-G2]
MKTVLALLFTVCCVQLATAQVVINELDCDTSSLDTLEFIELKSDEVNYVLDGLVVVLFNGSNSGGNSSYYTIDLTGYQTDLNGLLLIGSDNVSPSPQLVIPENVIQNGADAVAIYEASWFEFPEGTLATQESLMDALVYDTNDSDDDLMTLLGVSQQINEGENGNKDTESIQRFGEGVYVVTTPTPRQLNDGSGIELNGIAIDVASDMFNEGEDVLITLTSEIPVDGDVVIELSLSNMGFDENDFSGETQLTILNGTQSVSTTISLIDDVADEGDEIMKISLGSLLEPLVPLNDNLELRIVDNDFVVADYGTPLAPTFGIVESTQSAEYYESLNMLSGDDLRQAIQDIVANPNVVRAQSYSDVIDILKEADVNPENSNQVWLVYSEEGRPKLDFQTSSINTNKWNREHTYPRSRGGFESIEEDDIADGVDLYWTTKADSLRHANSDAHGLRAADAQENSARSNLHYGQYNGPDGTLGSFKGDVARGVFFLAVRYNDLDVVSGYPDVVGQLGDLTTLLDWHRNDPPDDFEMQRNNVIYNWQFNRNPFIDEPELVEYIWGDEIGSVWNPDLSVSESEKLNVIIFPNPTQNQLQIKGLVGEANLSCYSIDGRLILNQMVDTSQPITLILNSGSYIFKLEQDRRIFKKRIVIK